MGLFLNWYLFGVETFQATPTKQDLDTFWEFFFKISGEHSSPFIMGTPPLEATSLSKKNSTTYILKEIITDVIKVKQSFLKGNCVHVEY